VAKPKEKTQAKKARKKPDCRRLSLYPLKPEEVIKAVLESPRSQQSVSDDDSKNLSKHSE